MDEPLKMSVQLARDLVGSLGEVAPDDGPARPNLYRMVGWVPGEGPDAVAGVTVKPDGEPEAPSENIAPHWFCPVDEDYDPGPAVLADIEAAIAQAAAMAKGPASALDAAKDAGPLAMLAAARALAVQVERSVGDPGAALRLRRGSYHMAGLLDALGVSPREALAIVAQGVADHHKGRGPARG